MVATLARLGDASKGISFYGFYYSIISAQQRLNNIQCYYFRAKKTGFDFMKFLITSLVILFLLSLGFVEVTQGLFWKDVPGLVEITLQIQLRDSEGRLVAYYEPTQVWVNSKLVHEYLDTKENKSIILKDGKNLEVFEWEQTITYRGNELATGFAIYKDGKLINTSFSNGFISEPGDVAFQSWRIVRLLN